MRGFRRFGLIVLITEPLRGKPPMDFPIAELMDQDACYAKLLAILHQGDCVSTYAPNSTLRK